MNVSCFIMSCNLLIHRANNIAMQAPQQMVRNTGTVVNCMFYDPPTPDEWTPPGCDSGAINRRVCLNM